MKRSNRAKRKAIGYATYFGAAKLFGVRKELIQIRSFLSVLDYLSDDDE